MSVGGVVDAGWAGATAAQSTTGIGVALGCSRTHRNTLYRAGKFEEAQKAYEMALKEDDLPGNLKTLLSDQKATLRVSHDKIKALRDAQV